jgi:flagellar motor switch/type III secretory pathway protein FliN
MAAEQALVPAPEGPAPGVSVAIFGPASRLPVEVDVGVPLRDFRVRNLLSLESGTVVASQWAHGEDVPLAAGHVQLAWAEFEVVDTELAVRITRLI